MTNVNTEVLYDAPDADVHVWSGGRKLRYGGQIYTPSHGLLNVSPSAYAGSRENTSLTVSIPIMDSGLRARLLQDFRRSLITVTWIKQDPATARWYPLNLIFTGQLGKPKIKGNVYTVEIQAPSQEQFVENRVELNDDYHQREHPGDTGLRFMKKIATTYRVDWPPRYFRS